MSRKHRLPSEDPELGGQSAPAKARHPAHPRREVLVALALGFVLPAGTYYLLRAMGTDAITALLIGSAPALLRTLFLMVRRRTIDRISLFTLSLLVAGALAATVTGSPRWLLARGGVSTAVVGIWILWSLRGRTLAFEGIVYFQRSDREVAAWEANWRDSPEFRHVMRAVTALWGVGFLAEAIIRVTLAYTLPVDTVPVVTSVQFLILIGLMLYAAPRYGRWYMNRHGLTTGPDGISTVRTTTTAT